MLLYIYGEWKLTGFFSIVVIADFQITSSAEFLWCSFCSGQRDKSCSHHFVLNLASQTSCGFTYHKSKKEWIVIVVDFVVSRAAFVQILTTYWCLLLSLRFQCDMTIINTSDAEDEEDSISITSSAEFLWSFICSGHREKSCSHHFVLNLASQTSVSIEFAPDCIWIVQCLQISLSQSSSVRTNPDNVFCGLRHPMNLVPFATRVHMDVKALPSRPSVPLLITNSQRRNSILFMTAMKDQFMNCFSRSRWHSQIAFTVLMIIVFNVLVRNCEDESRILNDLHRI
ncbi:hypothetical protein T01_3762, partial [Trichinella spiralis]